MVSLQQDDEDCGYEAPWSTMTETQCIKMWPVRAELLLKIGQTLLKTSKCSGLCLSNFKCNFNAICQVRPYLIPQTSSQSGSGEDTPFCFH